MISIVIPAYNEEAYIEQCLRSLLAQKTRSTFEVIVVNNNSTDNTLAIIEKYATKLPLRIVHEDKQGIVFARSRGFDEAKGDIIARIDADCVAPEDWIDTIAQNFQKDIDGLCGNYHFYDGPRIANNEFHKHIYLTLMRQAFGHETMFGFNCALTKDMWQKIRKQAIHMPMRMHEDLALGTLVSQHGTLYFDKNLHMNTSFRRMYRSLYSFLIDYNYMAIVNILYARFYRFFV